MSAAGYVPDPAHLRAVALGELVQAFGDHRAYLVDARGGRGDAPAPVRVTSAVLDLLAVGTAIAEHVTTDRWALVVDALAAGTPVEAVATAAGADPGELVLHARLWADTYRRRGELTDAVHGEIVAVLDRVAGGAR